VKESLRLILAAFALAAAAFAGAAHGQATEQARRAFFAVESDPFEKDAVKSALLDLQRAHEAEPGNAWVLIALSRLLLEQGYIQGDRSQRAAYRSRDLKAADGHARQALELAPEEPMAHVQVARLQIIAGDHAAAAPSLDKAAELAPDDFYPWYYRAVIALKAKDAQAAIEGLDAAQARAAMPFQKEWVVDRRIDVAQLKGDPAEEERLHKQLIAISPASSHYYGNYALFLRKQKRFDESVEHYRKALAIRPYRLAREQLQETQRLRGAAKR
jgi:tetratricopeptide (TPR) repeat protein